MRSSKQWWEETKADPQKLNEWLIKQYRGEATAAVRIREFAMAHAPSPKDQLTLGIIAGQELLHAEWVLELLKARGLEPDLDGAEERYWKETLPGIESFETGAGVAAHAEAMRLERIEVIANDPQAPKDVRETFRRIYADEQFHADAFSRMAGSDGLNRTRDNHEQGMKALGLVL